jgi:hypothetical protein
VGQALPIAKDDRAELGCDRGLDESRTTMWGRMHRRVLGISALVVGVWLSGCGREELKGVNEPVVPENDDCPDDPDKTEPGICGCGIADDDTDGDSLLDCQDGCPTDVNKDEPGLCGCDVSDGDTDGDSFVDCDETCILDPHKQEPGICGCGASDADSDGDDVPNCHDECPMDPTQWVVGPLGCEEPVNACAPVTCVANGKIDDVLTKTNCCNGSAKSGSTYCVEDSDWGVGWASCGHICGTGSTPVQTGDCVPSGAIHDMLGHDPCCSGATVPDSMYCVNPADCGTSWATCMEICQ